MIKPYSDANVAFSSDDQKICFQSREHLHSLLLRFLFKLCRNGAGESFMEHLSLISVAGVCVCLHPTVWIFNAASSVRLSLSLSALCLCPSRHVSALFSRRFKLLSERLCFHRCQSRSQSKAWRKCKMLWREEKGRWGRVGGGEGEEKEVGRKTAGVGGDAAAGQDAVSRVHSACFPTFDSSRFSSLFIISACTQYFGCSLERQTHRFALRGGNADGKMLHSPLTPPTPHYPTHFPLFSPLLRP